MKREALTVLAFTAATCARAQHLQLFPSQGAPGRAFEARGADPELEALGRSQPWSESEAGGFRLTIEPGEDPGALEEAVAAPLQRRCVLAQCETLPIPPAKRLFTTGVTLWTAAGLLGGFTDGVQGPIAYGFQRFHFTDEAFFETWTYGGGADKASHCVISANVAGLLYDAYALNGLSEDQSFALSLATVVTAGALVELGDGLTPYGFSAQDLTADAVGALAGSLVKRGHFGDVVGFRIGKIPGTLPPSAVGGHVETLGSDYSNEMDTMDMKVEGVARRLHAEPGLGRFFLFSFVFLTKGYGYDPPIPSRYQEVGLEVGLNFPEILRTAGIDDSTWWGDFLLRAFSFVRIPYTQVGAYYNLRSRRWYGPGAPYHYE